jgi:hypothetical protein
METKLRRNDVYFDQERRGNANVTETKHKSNLTRNGNATEAKRRKFRTSN